MSVTGRRVSPDPGRTPEVVFRWTASGWQAVCEAAQVTAFGRTIVEAAEGFVLAMDLAKYTVPEVSENAWRPPRKSGATAHHRVRRPPLTQAQKDSEDPAESGPVE